MCTWARYGSKWGHWYLMHVPEEFWGRFGTSPNFTETAVAGPVDSTRLPECAREAHTRRSSVRSAHFYEPEDKYGTIAFQDALADFVVLYNFLDFLLQQFGIHLHFI
jgi:hypothetical protein